MERPPGARSLRLAAAALVALIPLALTLAVVTPAVTASPAPSPETRAAAAARTSHYVGAVWSATGHARSNHDLRRFGTSKCLKHAAHRQAVRMARSRELTHTRDLGAVMRRCGLRSVGENVAMHPGTGRAVVRTWMHSSGHRANILNPGYGLLAVAAVRRSGQWWAVQVFGHRG